MVLTELWWFQKKIFYIRMCKFIELLLSRQFMIKATDCIHYSVNSPLLYLMLGRELTKYMSIQCIVVRKYCLLMHNTHLCISVWNYFRRSILFMTIHFYKINLFIVNFNFLWIVRVILCFRTCMPIGMLMQKLFGPFVCLYIPICNVMFLRKESAVKKYYSMYK